MLLVVRKSVLYLFGSNIFNILERAIFIFFCFSNGLNIEIQGIGAFMYM